MRTRKLLFADNFDKMERNGDKQFKELNTPHLQARQGQRGLQTREDY